ncbi:MliC family protein [Aquabacter spiritensis]|uniref:Membrane-bound inhibitor of C-type lysozyme n=1 Tax=Aquabacter spiritensis TaxID=933073 RepID=A0A4R3LWX6_9HYPH|nr:MliC family protein [Aquabacter spiritensis]TCT04289.1 membrane-bound inhibitor of C-type lysozyme [Aquabacter spiritensis]
MKTILFASAALAVATLPAHAETIVLPIPKGTKVQSLKASYQCVGLGPVTVDYINAGDVALALLPVDGKPLVFVNVLAASGARYAAGPYVWWTNGTTAALHDLRKGEEAAPIQCSERQ